MKLQNSVIVITGGAKGLGKEMAKILLSKESKVVLCDKDEAEGVIKADVTNESDLLNVAKKTVEEFGRIDLWINNAGIWMAPQALEETDLEKAHKLFDVNVFGTICGMRTAIRQMKIQNSGTIMNIISTTAFDGMNGSSGAMYVSSKYALRGLTNVIREEVAVNNISVIAVYPGGMKTDLFQGAVPENADHFMSATDIAEKIIENLEKDQPETQLMLKRPDQPASYEFDSITKENK